MPALIEGVYKQGRIELSQIPPGLREGPVRVIVLEAGGPVSESGGMTFGKYSGVRMSTADDFREAEWRGEEECADSDGR